MKCEEKEHQNDPTIYIAGQYDSNNCPSVDINDELISSRLDNPISNFEGNIVNEAFESNHLLKDKNTSLTNKKKWTSEEDELLKKAVMIYGKKNWCSVCTLVPGRNSKQCRERWTAQINPQLTKQSWTLQEDQTLLQLHKIHGNLWAHIAMFLPGRSGNSVKNRFNWLERRHLTTFPMCSPPIRSGSLPTRMRPNLLPIPIINIKNEKEGKQNDTSSNIITSPPSSNDIIQNTIVSTKEMLDNRTSCHYMADCDPSSPESPELNNNSVVGLDLFNPNDFEEIWIEPTTNEEYMYFHVEY